MANESPETLSKTVDKLTINAKPKIADRARYVPPHRKHLQGTQAPPPTPAMATPTLNEPNKALGAGLPESPIPIEETFRPNETIAATSSPETDGQTKTTARAVTPHRETGDQTISTDTKPAQVSAAEQPGVAESWEDETTSDNETKAPVASLAQSASTSTTEPTTSPAKPASNEPRLAPHLKYRSTAPSPSPNRPERSATPPSRGSTPTSDRSDRRPETTNAVAHRLIAGALGVKMPRRTEEQRAYDKAMREQERKKRDQEREAKKKAEEETARAKAAIWDD